jgi:hypothetical protein
MILDEASMRALSRRFGLAARLPPNTVQRGVDLAMGPTPGETTSLGGPWELASMSSPSGFRLNMDCA